MQISSASTPSGRLNRPLQVNATQGAAVTDLNSLPLQPCNWVSVYGEPGQHIIANVDTPLNIPEADNSSYYDFHLNEQGYANFRVVCTHHAEARAAYILYLYDDDNPQNHVERPLTFAPYFVGNGAITAYNYTVGAPANGLTPCSIYVVVDMSAHSSVNSISVRVDQNAVIANSPDPSQKIFNVPLDSDGCATINITNKFSEEVFTSLTLSQSPDGEHISFKLPFITFPSL